MTASATSNRRLSTMPPPKRLVALLLFVVLITLAVPASVYAASPWWGLTSGSWPTNLHTGVAQDEVQDLTVSATAGIFVLEHEGTPVALVKFNATHEELQTALELAYGAGNVEVSGGPGDEEGTHPYIVTFTVELADKPVSPIETLNSFFGKGLSCNGATGSHCTAETSVHETTTGRPDGKLIVTAENLGDAPVEGTKTPVVLEDTLPAHLEAVSAEATEGNPGTAVPCSLTSAHGVRCEFVGTLPPYVEIELRIGVRVAGASSGEMNTVTASGGGTTLATSPKPISVGNANGFGIADYQMLAEEEGGAESHQAGVYPFQLTTLTTLDASEAALQTADQQPAGMVKDLTYDAPPGLIGNPTPLPECTDEQFSTIIEGILNACEAKTAIGVATVTYDPPKIGFSTATLPVFNLVPRAGEPARFGFIVDEHPIFLDTSVRTGGDYGVTVKVSNITQVAGFISSKLTFWGVPADPTHDNARGWECLGGRATACSADVTKPAPFLSMPTSCTGTMLTTIQADSWEQPHPAQPFTEPLFVKSLIGGLDGCNRLQFEPEIRVTPDSTQASKPTGLNVDVHVPQTGALNPKGLAESAVKDITVALPEGVAVNPAGGNGLEGCSEGLAGFTGLTGPEHTATFTGTLPEPLQPGVNFCPNASKIGEVTIHSPLLPPTQPVKGFVYLATQNQNPFGSLIALYLVAKDPISGFVFKTVGETRLCEGAGETIDGMACQAPGRVIATFLNNPQLAFEDAELHFFGEERAPLTSPARCGPHTTRVVFTPWAGTPPVSASSTFDITSGPNGSPCPGATLPFSPSLTGGTTNINAGGFSPLVTTIGREDGQQNMQSVVLHMPAGLEGLLSSVKLCPEAQANDGTCGPESLIGETLVSAGVGSDPVTVVGGKVYLTEKYAGAPFGLSIVNPVKAGPFDLERDTANPAQNPACDCIVVRAKIDVDPHTAALTITTDPSGPHAIPDLIDGVPVQIRKVNVTIDREHFTFNPTSCNPLSLTGVIAGDEGGAQPLSVPFQATNCAVLKFKPTITVSTAARASKANGTSVKFKIAYPKGAMGSESWMNEMKFDIPRQLPARLTTIQKACLAATFETDRAACPAASIIGHVLVHTQVLPVPLEGPLYFVSYGGAAFPDAVAVLHGYGVTIESHGHTFINGKTGVTSATFESVPDVPFESIEVTVPAGPFSEFGANLPHGGLSFCGQKLRMPIRFRASNGLEISEDAPVGVTGCPKRLTRAQKLAAALRACRHKHGATRRACERAARRAYGASRTKR